MLNKHSLRLSDFCFLFYPRGKLTCKELYIHYLPQNTGFRKKHLYLIDTGEMIVKLETSHSRYKSLALESSKKGDIILTKDDDRNSFCLWGTYSWTLLASFRTEKGVGRFFKI